MEEVYILSDGSQVDISNFSDFEKISFLSKNPGAKKQKGVAKSATVAPKKNQALNTDSSSEDGSLVLQKTRQETGIKPPPSAKPRKTVDELLKEDYKRIKSDFVSEEKIKLPGQRTERKLKGKLIGSKEDMKKFVENFRDDPITGELGENSKFKVAKLKEKIQETDSDLIHPYLYYSSKNQQSLNPVEEEQVEDDFIERNYRSKELEAFGVNPQDFDGYLNKKGYKEDFKKKEAEGLFTGDGRSFGGYDIGLARELARKKMLLMYMDEMKSRDVNRQDLNQELEIVQGVRDKKEIINNDIFDPNGMAKYVENYFPTITKKLKDKDKDNAKLYEESKKGGTDFFSWDTAEKIGRASWNAVIDRTAQMSASGYQALGMESTAEGIRMLDEENKFVRRDDRGIAYVSGKTVNYNGDKYIVDSKGQIYDAEAKIRVTDLFDQSLQKKLVEEAKYGPSDWTFSTQGAAVQTSGVMADMLLQAAITRGVGKLGTAAGEIRYASNVAKPASGFTTLLNDSSKLLRKVPLDRATGYSMIAQGTMGYAQGYEDTLKAARDNGINDKDAFELASAAGQRMAVLYGTTGVINPQTKLVENLFGSKNIVKKAIEQYTKTGKTGFINYIDDIVKNAPKNAIEFAEEGGKEVVQENIQQAGEIGVNMLTNKDAGKKIMNEVMSGDDFMNTSILSFISSGLISKAKLPSFHAGDQDTDNLTSLSTLAKNKKEFTKIIDGLVTQNVFTTDQAESLKKDVDIYANNVNKLPKTITPDTAMPIMRELDKITKLTDEKQTVDKAFHPEIDEKIESIRQDIAGIKYESDVKVKNKAIANAIKKGIISNAEMKTFSSTVELENYLITEFDIDKKEAKLMAKRGGFMLDESNLKNFSKNPETVKPGQKIFFVNEEVGKALDAPEIIQHEFGHGLIYETIKNDPEAQMLLGVALSKELVKLQDASNLKGDGQTPLPEAFIKRFGKYVNLYKGLTAEQDAKLELGTITKQERDATVNKYLGNQWEEIITLYSDAISNGSVKYNEGTFTKLGDTIRRVLQYLGLKDIKFESGKDVYNFIKDYNKSVETGSWGVAMKKLGTKGAEINKETLRKETGMKSPVSKSTDTSSDVKYSLAPDRKSSEDIKKDVNKGYDKEKWSAGTNDRGENPAIDRVLYDILNEYEYIIKGKAKGLGYSNLPDYSEMDMISETQIELMPHIRNFNKEFFQKREEYKKELIDKGLKPESKEFKDKVEAQDLKGYQGKKGIVKENNDLNAWINSQLVNKMGNALRSGNVTTQKFTEDIDNEMFKETKIIDGYGGEDAYLMDEGNNIFDAEQDYAEEQGKLAVLLADPVYSFVDEQGKPIDIETVPFGSFFVTEATDPLVAANRKLKTETDPTKIAELNKQIKDLARGLELQAKTDITFEEKEELKSLKSFKSYDLSTGMMVNTFKALSVQDTPAKIITDEVGREILRSPNIETLEYRNFKEKLSTLSKTMARRMTFKNGPEIESLMYREWQLLYDVINHPLDTVTDQSSYSSKKIPPRLKMFDEQGNRQKVKNITRVKFLQSYYGIEEATRIIKTYGKNNVDKQLNSFDDVELNEKTGKNLWNTAYFDRRTALMEMFGDVMVLQEARRLIRQPEFLSRIAERNVNLYNDLKDDVIRAKVLNDMAKGKSDIVKFSLAKEEDSPTTNTGEVNRYNSLTATGKALTKGIANNILFGYDSAPKFNDIVKFSLSELDERKSNTVSDLKEVNKKYENNFKTTSKTDDATRNKNYYIRTLQYSDLTDTMPGTKLHTFKTYEEVENEVTTRIKETFDSMIIYPRKIYNDNEYIDPDTGEIDKSFKNDSKINPFVIEDYRDGYIDTMLQKSIEKQDSRYIEYWTEVKNDPIFRKNEIESINRKQWLALNDVVETLYDGQLRYHNGKKIEPNELKSPNGLKFNPFFTYLFLKDILSSKYITNANTESSERKSFKKSEYKTTLAPVDTYIDLIIKDVYDNFSDIKTPPGMVYSLLNIKYGKTFVEDWENNRKISKLDDVSIFKFKQSTNWNDVYSLNRLAANNTNPDGLWCTGQRVADARSQLEEGDFFIGANKEYKPIIAVRLDEGYTYGVGEVVGTGFDQACRVKDFPLISKIFLESDLEEKEKFANLFTVMHDIFVSNGENSFKDTSNKENQDLLKDAGRMAKEAFFRLELDKKDKTSLIKKLKIMKSNLIEKGLHTSTVDLGSFVVSASSNILDITKENIELLEEQIKITENELGVDESDEGSIDIQAVNEEGDIQDVHFELPLLEEISSVAFSGVTKFTAPSLAKGDVLLIKGTLETSFDGGYLELNSFIDFPVDIEVDLIEDGNNFMLSEKDIDFNSNILSIRTNFRISEDVIEEEGTSIDIAAAINTSMIELTGLAENVYLPSDIDELNITTRTYKNSYIPNGTIFIGTKSINKLFLKVPVYEEVETFEIEVDGVKQSFETNNFNVNNIGFQNENTSIGKTVFLVSEKPTDKFIQDILKSEIGLLSSAITVRGDIFSRDENGIGQFDDYVLNIKEPNQNQDVIKFSLAETKEDVEYKKKFKNLINSKEYTDFYDKVKNQRLYHFGSKSIEGTIKEDEERAIWFYVDIDDAQESQYMIIDGKKVFEPMYGDGIVYKTTGVDLPGAIIIPDIELAGGDFSLMMNKKFPKAIQQIIKNKKVSKAVKEAGKIFTGGQPLNWHTNRLPNGKESEKFLVVGLRDILETDYADDILSFWMKYISNPPENHFNGLSRDDVGLYEDDKVAEGIEVIAFGKMNTQNEIKKLRENGGFDVIKFSLAEEENGRLSNFLEGLPFSEQWVVARDIDKAILKGKTAEGNNTVFKVPSMSKSTDKAIAYTIISKVAAGYNDFEFKVKKNANGPLTRQVLNALDFKSKEVQERMRLNNNLEQGMNEIIEQNKGIKAEEKFSPETAKNIGKNIDNNKIFLPPEDEDFLGLLYTLGSGKGTQGEKQMKFLTDNLLKPYSNAMLNLMKARQTMYKDWRSLINKKHKGISKELKQDSGYGGYLVDQAVRVYLWKKAGYEIPGLDSKDLFHLVQIVRTNPKLREFAEDVSLLSKQANGYVEPGHNWGFGSVVGDINNIISKSNRTKFLEQWQGNADKIFSKDNMSKIEAVYGRKYVKALENMLYRMKTGSNRAEGASDSLLNWINGSTAVTMFWNARSAVLQVLGGINYINTSDNNIVKAGFAMLNIPQYTKDFFTIWNSDYVKDRRSGLMNDVAEAEFAQLMNDPRNNTLIDKLKAANYFLLRSGFTPTRVMDSFAIAFGGAGFYRNRLKTYLKEGMSEEDATKATMRDFYEISEISQQSADVSKISMNQASTKGRLLLSFMNTPFQYSRIIKKSFIDIAKGRGSLPNNIAKIAYYSVIQNLMFNALQNALFSIVWDDDDEQEQNRFNTAKMRTINGALDTLIRGTGLKGVLLATVKNAFIKWYEKSGDPKAYGDVMLELANVSPSIGIKLRALVKSYKAIEYNKDEIMYKGFSLDNTYAIEAGTSLTSATLNFPADRLYLKMQNIGNALNDEYTNWQRIYSLLGYSKYNLGIEEAEEDTGEELKVPGLSETELKIPELK